MPKLVFVLVTIFVLFSCSDNKLKKQQTNTNTSENNSINSESIKKSDIQKNKSPNEQYFIYSFWDNPFLDYKYQPDYFGKNIKSKLNNDNTTLIINEIQINDIDWTNGYYYKTQIKNKDFETYYLSPFDKSSYRRPLLVITGNDLKLKSNIHIGMEKEELLEIIKNNDQNSYVEYEKNKITVTSEEVWVKFIFNNKYLETIEIQVGN